METEVAPTAAPTAPPVPPAPAAGWTRRTPEEIAASREAALEKKRKREELDRKRQAAVELREAKKRARLASGGSPAPSVAAEPVAGAATPPPAAEDAPAVAAASSAADAAPSPEVFVAVLSAANAAPPETEPEAETAPPEAAPEAETAPSEAAPSEEAASSSSTTSTAAPATAAPAPEGRCVHGNGWDCAECVAFAERMRRLEASRRAARERAVNGESPPPLPPPPPTAPPPIPTTAPPPPDASDGEDAAECLVCMDELGDYSCRPCGCPGLCRECVAQLTECPMCRTKIAGCPAYVRSDSDEARALREAARARPREAPAPAPAPAAPAAPAGQRSIAGFFGGGAAAARPAARRTAPAPRPAPRRTPAPRSGAAPRGGNFSVLPLIRQGYLVPGERVLSVNGAPAGFRGELTAAGKFAIAAGALRAGHPASRRVFDSVSAFAKEARGGRNSSGPALTLYHRDGRGSGVKLKDVEARMRRERG